MNRRKAFNTQSKKTRLRSKLEQSHRDFIPWDFYKILSVLTPKERKALVCEKLYDIWQKSSSPADIFKTTQRFADELIEPLIF